MHGQTIYPLPLPDQTLGGTASRRARDMLHTTELGSEKYVTPLLIFHA